MEGALGEVSRSDPTGGRQGYNQAVAAYDGVRGGFPAKTMNVYLIEDDGGVTMFDGGIRDMADAVRVAGSSSAWFTPRSEPKLDRNAPPGRAGLRQTATGFPIRVKLATSAEPTRLTRYGK